MNIAQMKKSIIYIIFNTTLFCNLFSQNILSTDYPFLRKINLNAKVNMDNSTRMFYYSYTLINDITSHGNVTQFWLDISRGNSTVNLDTIGLHFSGSGLIERWFRKDFPPRQNSIVPVGFPNLPRHCTASLGNGCIVSFDIDTLDVKPGKILSGFTIMSKGLPTIRWFKAFPYLNIYEYFSNIEDTTSNMSIEQMDSIREAVNYNGLTVGPIAPPINIISTVWCDTLTSYATRSRALGWINDDAMANKYFCLFALVKTKLAQQENVEARTVLQQILKDVDIDSTSAITSEAYALLRFNTEYLIKQLPIQPTK